MAIFLIGALDVENQEIYGQYVEGATPAVIDSKGQPLAVDDAPVVLEGVLPGQRVILMRFEDQASLDAFYKSETYQTAMKHRLASAKTNFLIALQGLPGA